VNYIVWAAMGGFCDSQEELILDFANNLNETFVVPGENVTINVGAQIPAMLACKGNTTLIDIFQVQFLITDLQGAIQTRLDQINTEKQLLNQTNQYYSAEYFVGQFLNSTDIDLYQGKNLTAIIGQLSAVSMELNNLTNFGFSDTAYNQSLVAVNQITNNLTLTNGTVLYYYYDSSNITELNPNSNPFDQTDTDIHASLVARVEVAQNLTNVRNQILVQVGHIQGNISNTQLQLENAQNYVDNAEISIGTMKMFATQIIEDLNESYSLSLLALSNVTFLTNDFVSKINIGIAEFVNNTECAFLGSAYSSVTTSVCVTIKPTFEYVTAMLLLNAGSLFVVGIASSWFVQRIKKDALLYS